MPKATHDSVMDAALNKLAEADQIAICSAQPLTYYEGIDPPAWSANAAAALGDPIRPTVRNGYVYECTTAGTTGSSEPAWPTTPGQTVTDGSVVWTCRNNYSLAQGSLVSGDFTIADGDNSGRKVTVAAKTGLPIHTSGTANYVATMDDATRQLRDVTTTAAQALTAGGTVDTSAWKHEIADPT